MHEFVERLGTEWFFFTYENMVKNNYDELDNYLGFTVLADAEVPQTTGKAKVIRKKAAGDWRHWFTDEDISLLKPANMSYMALTGYDCDDWNLAENPMIEPEYSSVYMQQLARRATKNIFHQYLGPIVKRFASRS